MVGGWSFAALAFMSATLLSKNWANDAAEWWLIISPFVWSKQFTLRHNVFESRLSLITADQYSMRLWRNAWCCSTNCACHRWRPSSVGAARKILSRRRIVIFIWRQSALNHGDTVRRRDLIRPNDVQTVVKVRGLGGLSPCSHLSPPAIVWAPWLNL